MEADNTSSLPVSRRILRGIVWTIVIIAVIVAYLWAMMIYRDTIVEWHTPWSIALVLSLLSWFPLRGLYGRVLPDYHVILRLLIHFAGATGLWLLLILGLNSWCADKSSLHTEQATVVGHFREKRYHTQRVTRKVYRRGQPYYEYIVRMQFPEGREKDFTLPFEKYKHLRNGMTIEVPVSRGLLGFPVIDRPRELEP